MSIPELRVTLTLPADLEDLACALFTEAGETAFQIQDATTLDHGDTGTVRLVVQKPAPEVDTLVEVLETLWDQVPALADLSLRQALSVEEGEVSDWTNAWQKGLEPVHLGPFTVAAHFMEVEEDPSRIVLRIDPGMAFGTGLHATTQMASRALVELRDEQIAPRRVLDMGSGSGILAMMASHLFGCPVQGVEIDLDALAASREIVADNGLDGRIALADTIPEGAVYDLIVANINGPALLELKPLILGHLAPGGHLILTGILSHQAEEIRKMYGLSMEKTVSADEWVLFALVNQ